ncbi:transposase [Candidatus Enterovibrio escicola]|uniref:transposase n=1 Tax=Candidatus Enterovibrio escicola TaxID=1927127 RepID=UPI001237DBF0|nr:transposase [Candidatus Enterovibrio escacola]
MKRGKGTIRSFYDFKFHLIVNEQGGIISVKVTISNMVDIKPVLERAEEIWGVYT